MMRITRIHSLLTSLWRAQMNPAILAALQDGPHYSLELARATCIPLGWLYALLSQLEGQGLIESYWDETYYAERGGYRRRYYKLTPEGEEAVKLME